MNKEWVIFLFLNMHVSMYLYYRLTCTYTIMLKLDKGSSPKYRLNSHIDWLKKPRKAL